MNEREGFYDWQAAQHADELQTQERLLMALLAADAAGTPKSAVIELAAGLGLAKLYTQEKK